MAILARYANRLDVAVVDVLITGDGRKLALVQALSGEPFTVCTHGGPMDTDSALVSPDLLSDVHQVPTRRSRREPSATRPEPVYLPLEDAAVFPVPSRRKPWKGINSD